ALSTPDGIVFEANPAYFHLYGYSPEEVIGKNYSICVPGIGISSPTPYAGLPTLKQPLVLSQVASTQAMNPSWNWFIPRTAPGSTRRSNAPLKRELTIKLNFALCYPTARYAGRRPRARFFTMRRANRYVWLASVWIFSIPE